jgi:hypothetical protein
LLDPTSPRRGDKTLLQGLLSESSPQAIARHASPADSFDKAPTLR